MVDRTVRSLEFLENSASTSRVFNLRMVAKRKKDDPEYAAKPVFQNSTLNTSIIVKHRLRGNEVEHFHLPRRSATKILIPIQQNDLKIGARYVFIGQRQFEQSLFETFGVEIDANSADHRTLRIFDETPSLDPFLLREQLRRQNLEPARCYFEISPADTQRMFKFAQSEIQSLVRMSIGGLDGDGTQSAKLTQKILANSADADLEPLRLTLQLDKTQYQEGIFCWKAFLYYKWQLGDLLPKVSSVLKEIETKKPVGPQSDEIKAYISGARKNIRRALMQSCRDVKDTLGVYDAAYHGLTTKGAPNEFRDFLLKAPSLFNQLGEQLGAIEQIVSFWRFQFPPGRPGLVSPEDLAELFRDFESGLSQGQPPTGGASRIAPSGVKAA